MQLPRLLWLAIEPPWPSISGGRLRTAALLHAAAQRFAVTLVVLFGDGKADRGPISGIEWVTCGAGAGAKLIATMDLLAHRRPPYLRHFGTPAQRRAVQTLLSADDYSVVVADTPYSAAALPDSERLHWASGALARHATPSQAGAGRPALVVNTHNVEAEAWRAATVQLSGSRALRALDRRLVGAWERAVLASADAATFCSPRDRAALETAMRPGAHTAIVPNAVDTETLKRLDSPAESSEALFVGGLGYGPNREAAHFIGAELAPLLRGSGTSVVIAGGQAVDLGSAEAKAMSRCAADGTIRFAGRPVDLRPLYEGSYATVMPIFFGSGTRLKVLESFAFGRPVVSTAKGVEGLAAIPNEHYLRAETGREFAAQLRALRDPRLADRLAHAGRALVEERYSWSVAGDSFLRLLDATLRTG